MAWSLIFHKNTIRNCSTALQAFSFRSLSFYQKQPTEAFCKKKELLEISQNSQENNCARASFLVKLQALNFAKFLKACFYRTPPDGCFCCIFSFFIKARILLQFLSPVFSILFSPFFFVFINALLIST